jgi:serine/threonine-protein kinase RsbW
MSSKRFPRSIQQLDKIVAFTVNAFDEHEIDPQLRFVVDLAVEELFVNMVKYNLGSTSDIELEMAPIDNGIEVSITDYDVEKYDPTARPPVDIDAPLEERTPGGLGVYLVMKMVDSISYQYGDKSSKITFTKTIET